MGRGNSNPANRLKVGFLEAHTNAVRTASRTGRTGGVGLSVALVTNGDPQATILNTLQSVMINLCRRRCQEFIVVDNGSTDETHAAILYEPQEEINSANEASIPVGEASQGLEQTRGHQLADANDVKASPGWFAPMLEVFAN